MKKYQKSDAGYTLIELMIVLIIISIMSAVSGYYLINHQTLYKPDDQALKIIDIFQEARQRSLTQRGTMRVEIDLNDNMIRLIDENKPMPTGAADDEQIRQLPLLPASDVQIEQRAPDVADNPPETLPVPSANFLPSVYPSSTPNRVCTIRFQSNGLVVSAGNSPADGNAPPTGVTLHIWSPKKSSVNESEVVRAITVIGTTGSVKMWEYRRDETAASKWVDSRRGGSY